MGRRSWVLGLVLGGMLVGCGQGDATIVVDALTVPTVSPVPTMALSGAAARHATSTVGAATRAPIQTAFAQDEQATVAAQPAEQYLTLREAFARGGIRERGTAWASDAVLVDAGIGYRAEGRAQEGMFEAIAANDGTARWWAFTFASARLKQTLVILMQDGLVTRSYADERSYRDLFVSTTPVDIPLESTPFLDSDQVRILFLNFGDLWETMGRPNHTFRLSSLPNEYAAGNPIYWWMQDSYTNATLLDPITGATIDTARKQQTTMTPPAKTLVPLLANPVPTLQPTATQPWQESDVVQVFWPTPRAGSQPMRVVGLYASDGIDYWIYRQGRWDMLRRAEAERVNLLRLGFPLELVP
ncbi:hypothetical protein [Herpetosiphon giganteus]|uniref:hypothetical protein n=1 Tax=Herpetosiphon giganteus TaxID=2029754 RepID=UPI00195E5412|nr:hypothetical protein [Herpetosiphon giganteus]MBM7845615.1 hypothetical protein [Herpetosiphon giganteus]